MFIGVSPPWSRYDLLVWRTIYSPTIYVQPGHFDALMTIDLGAMCWTVGLLVAIKFCYLQGLLPADPKTKIYHGKAVPKSMLMINFV